MKKIVEVCPTCEGTGLCDDDYGNESACYNCCGSGSLKYTLFDELTARADFYGYDSLTEKEQAYVFGHITLEQLEDDEF
jgi:hypothetical protein